MSIILEKKLVHVLSKSCPPFPVSHIVVIHRHKYHLLFQSIQNISFKALWLRSTRPSSLHLPIFSHEPFLKIPLHSLQAQYARLLRLQPLEQWLCIGAVHFGLAKDGEADAVVGKAEGLNSVVVTLYPSVYALGSGVI